MKTSLLKKIRGSGLIQGPSIRVPRRAWLPALLLLTLAAADIQAQATQEKTVWVTCWISFGRKVYAGPELVVVLKDPIEKKVPVTSSYPRGYLEPDFDKWIFYQFNNEVDLEKEFEISKRGGGLTRCLQRDDRASAIATRDSIASNPNRENLIFDWLPGKKLKQAAPELKPTPVADTGSAGKPAKVNNIPLTIKSTAAPPAGWTPEQLARAREASAERARNVARAAQNDARTKAALNKFFADMKKRGRAQ